MSAAVGILVLLCLSAPFLLWTDLPAVIVRNCDDKFVDGKIEFSNLRIRGLKMVYISADSLRICYPPEEYTDTLVSFDHLSVCVDLMAYLSSKRIMVPGIQVDGLRAHLERYEDGSTNLSVFRRGKEKQKENEGTGNFELHLGDAAIEGDIFLDGFGKYGNLHVPLNIDTGLEFSIRDSVKSLNLDRIRGNLAYVPLEAAGKAFMYGDSTLVKMSVAVAPTPLDTVFKEYGKLLPSVSNTIWSDGKLSFSADMDGVYGKSSWPYVRASAELKRGNVLFKPRDMKGKADFMLSAVATPDRRVSANLRRLDAVGEGFDLRMQGDATDLLGGNPLFDFNAKLKAGLGKLTDFLQLDIPVKTLGAVDFDLSARVTLSEITNLSFEKSALKGHLVSKRVYASSDSLDVKAFAPDIRMSSDENGIDLEFSMDSLFYLQGSAVAARIRRTRNHANLSMADYRGTMTPKLTVHSDNGRAFVKFGPHRFFGLGLDVEATAHKRELSAFVRRRHLIDSLMLANPELRRKDIVIPSYLEDKYLERGDVDISLDTAKAKLLQEWRLTGDLAMQKASFASPVIPLRTSFDGLNLHFDGNNLKIDTLGIICGTSDLGLKGRVNGLGRALVRKGNINVEASVKSRRMNMNEVFAALKAGENLGKKKDIKLEDDSFVTDTLADVIPELPPLDMIIVPANLAAGISADVDSLDITYFTLNPVHAELKMKDRIVRFTDSGFLSNYGDVSLDAFYSSQSRKDISAGVDLHLSDLDADQIIDVLPTVDNLIPVLKTLKGSFDCRLSATTQLDSNMKVIPHSLDGLLRIHGDSLNISDAGKLRSITSLLLFKNKNIGQIADFDVSAVAHDNRIEIFPFEFSVDRYKLALWGMQNLDRSMYYHASVLKAPIISRFGIDIYGTLDRWRFRLCRARYGEGQLPSFTKELNDMESNIRDYIRNILGRGTDDLNTFNSSMQNALSRREKSYNLITGDDGAEMPKSEYQTVTEELLRLQMTEDEASVEREVERILEQSSKESSRMIDDYLKSYTEEVYDRRIQRKIERMKRRESRKANS